MIETNTDKGGGKKNDWKADTAIKKDSERYKKMDLNMERNITGTWVLVQESEREKERKTYLQKRQMLKDQ